MDGITETLEGQVQGNAEEADAERKAIMEDLENKFINMESDLKRLLNSVSAQNLNFREIDSSELSIISTTLFHFGSCACFFSYFDYSGPSVISRTRLFKHLSQLFREIVFFGPSVISRTRPFSGL